MLNTLVNNNKQSITKETKQPIVIYVHIPKTAGTTLRHIVQSQFYPHNIFEFYNLRQQERKGLSKFEQLSEFQKNNISFVSGHIGFGLHSLLTRPCTYITILREPVERVVSHYFYLQNRNAVSKETTLEEFVQTYKRAQNSMTSFLSGLEFKIQAEQNIESNLEDFSEKSLNLAKDNIEKHFKVVGLVERFDETCLLLKKDLGWNIPIACLKKNVSNNRPKAKDLPRETVKLIEEFNQFDILLYQYAKIDLKK
ncbi:sulfotransferase family 2 domain-containing protein [Gloeocapsopsis sp. IPPAS B-1203]|uniref:sulfotransferase family 2 domain-containing protein n=1 Tax=Gloeocapsopsis sp. IPPAS B-1203 TaxID=2049454 RepID=UPI000C190EC6|nr:sulfotransferase family 2 domain-containing protein [Gloeocapsopsis sp. IPPAS B-1203]PIG90647.1 hypothetical protein CSQ79_25755 [Gloeocapsopsis sp. IPPAS B-1203]